MCITDVIGTRNASLVSSSTGNWGYGLHNCDLLLLLSITAAIFIERFVWLVHAFDVELERDSITSRDHAGKRRYIICSPCWHRLLTFE